MRLDATRLDAIEVGPPLDASEPTGNNCATIAARREKLRSTASKCDLTRSKHGQVQCATRAGVARDVTGATHLLTLNQHVTLLHGLALALRFLAQRRELQKAKQT